MIKSLNLLKIISIFSLFLAINACGLASPNSSMPLGASPLLTLAGIETISVINSQKTIGDHISSAFTKRDCSTPRAYIDKGEVCRDKPTPPPKQAKVYCYRTLGAPTCYREPSPNATDYRIGNN